MAGIRIGGTAQVPVLSGIGYTVQSLSDFVYLAQGLVELSDKTVDTFDEANNILLSPNQQWYVTDANFPGPNGEGLIFVEAATAVNGTPAPFQVSDDDAGGGYALHPSWHPDNDRILYVRGRAGFQGDIYEIQRTNPTVETAIYTNPDPSGATGWGVYRPQYSRDGTKVAWIRDKNAAPADGNDGLWVADADGTNLTQIDDFGGTLGSYLFDGSQFAWGPGNTIAYVNGVDEQAYLINADGTGQTLLSSDVDTSANPCRLSNRCYVTDDSYILGTSQTSKSFAGSWDMWAFALDGSGGTWIDLGIHGPAGAQYFRCVYVHNGRVHMIESKTGGRMISSLFDGTDITTDVDLGTNMDGDQFYDGTGIEWI